MVENPPLSLPVCRDCRLRKDGIRRKGREEIGDPLPRARARAKRKTAMNESRRVRDETIER